MGKLIVPETELERGLGITGDDGSELLEATEKQFKVAFQRDVNSVAT